MSALSRPELVLRCAWCRRYRVDGAWVELGPAEEPPIERVSHGICEDCLAGLRDSGKSL